MIASSSKNISHLFFAPSASDSGYTKFFNFSLYFIDFDNTHYVGNFWSTNHSSCQDKDGRGNAI